MAIPGVGASTQQEAVDRDLASQNKQQVETLRLPGIETLHTKSADEIAAVLTNVIKSRSGITKLVYVVGEGIEITYDGNPFNQLRG